MIGVLSSLKFSTAGSGSVKDRFGVYHSFWTCSTWIDLG